MTAGVRGNWEYIQFLRNELHGAWKPAFNNQSLSGFLMHVFTKGDISSWQNVDAPGWLAPIRFAIILAMLAGAGLAMLKRPGNSELCKNARDLDLSLIVFLMLLVSPVTWYHYYYWLLFPIIILFDEMLLSADKYAMKWMIAAGAGYAPCVGSGLIGDLSPGDPIASERLDIPPGPVAELYRGRFAFYGLGDDTREIWLSSPRIQLRCYSQSLTE